jgi:hypothetical protein
MAAPICSAGRQRGSGGESRADPMTATVRLAGDELIAAHPLLPGQRDDGAAQHPFGVFAARVDGQRTADPGLAA